MGQSCSRTEGVGQQGRSGLQVPPIAKQQHVVKTSDADRIFAPPDLEGHPVRRALHFGIPRNSGRNPKLLIGMELGLPSSA